MEGDAALAAAEDLQAGAQLDTPRVISYCSWVFSPSPISKGVLHCICDEVGEHQQ